MKVNFVRDIAVSVGETVTNSLRGSVGAARGLIGNAMSSAGKGKDAKTADASMTGDAAIEGSAAASVLNSATWQRVLASPVMFRSVAGLLLLLAVVQWSLIAFNYWR
ncbi:MAG: hypothetical protein AAF675_18910 [Pseudomonadota bacterium]